MEKRLGFVPVASLTPGESLPSVKISKLKKRVFILLLGSKHKQP